MAVTPTNSLGISAAGFAALQRGDARAARGLFNQAITADAADASVWSGLAAAHRALGESPEEHAALDRALRLDAYYLPAIVAKGDLFAKAGDRRAANSYYAAALKVAAKQSSLSPEWQAEMRRVAQVSRDLAGEYEAHLLASIPAWELKKSGNGRFAHAIDLLLGKRQIYLQQPKFFYYPELPQIQFFDRRTFPWVMALERQFDAIRAEARALLDEDSRFVPYIQREQNRPTFNERGLLDNPNWGAFFLIKDGVAVEENAARCPRTFAAVSELPLCRIDKRTPSVLFSLLRPGAKIPPHHGFMNARLICHLPLIVPPKCALRVGNETRTWVEGETVLFDDSIEHEAWNASNLARIVLILDVWRPELSLEERELVSTVLAAVDSFGGARPKWTE